jgi:hypothetical protein
MKIRLLVILFLVTACSPEPEPYFNRTLHVSADKLDKIQTTPYIKWYQPKGPTARLAGLEDDPWPDGILFSDYGAYLEGLGFGRRQMLAEIDGQGVHAIFNDRWITKSIKRPAGFHRDHYEDLIIQMFKKAPGEQVVLTMYMNVPSSAKKIGEYSPEVEHWQIVFDAEET